MGVNTERKLKAYIDLTLAMFISGSAVVVNKLMVSSLPTFLATESGILCGLFILIPFTLIKNKCTWKLDKQTYFILLAQAFFGIFLYRIFTFTGLKFTTAATSGLITSAAPVIVLLLAKFILKEKTTVNQIIAIIFTVIGLSLINLAANNQSAGHGSLLGNLLIMAAVICEALFSILSKVKCKPISALCRTTIIAIDAFLLLLPFTIYDAFQYDFRRLNIGTIICIAYYGVFVSFLSYVLWFRGIEKTKAGNAAVFTSVVPISSIMLSVFILKESLHPLQLISLFLIVTSIWISLK